MKHHKTIITFRLTVRDYRNKIRIKKKRIGSHYKIQKARFVFLHLPVTQRTDDEVSDLGYTTWTSNENHTIELKMHKSNRGSLHTK